MKRVACFFLLTLMLQACSTVNVDTKLDEAIDFGAFSSYAWLTKEDSPGEDIRVNNPLVTKSVRQSVDSMLQNKGYQKVAADQADLLVTWVGAIDKKISTDDIDHFYNRYGYGALFRDPALKTTDPRTRREFDQSTLVIDVFSREANRIIWRGSGKERVEPGMSESEVVRYIDTSVSQILKGFPPAGK